jgi:hypothetical protein
LSLGAVFERVVIPVLQYKGEHHPAAGRAEVLSSVLSMVDDKKYCVQINTTHFALITKAEWLGYEAEWYAAGNWEVLRHMAEIGVNVLYVERSWDYASSKERRNKRPGLGRQRPAGLPGVL